jgi:hypothetical protein
VALDLHSEVVPALPSGDDVHDGVPRRWAKMKVWSECSGASCNDGEVWLEVSGMAMPCRARGRTMCMRRSREWRSYQ